MSKLRQFSKGQDFFIIMFILVCVLLFFADGAAFNLISAPLFVNDLISYATLSVAIILTIITLIIVLRDIRQGMSLETHQSDIARTSAESSKKIRYVPSSDSIQKNTGKVEYEYEDEDSENAKILYQTTPPPVKTSSNRILFVTMIAIVVAQLIFANGVAFGLIALPESSIYAAIAGAVALTVITFAVALKDIQRSAYAKTQKPDAVAPQKEPNKTPVTLIQPVKTQKSTSALDLPIAKQKNQSTKQLIRQPTKLICPTCRKEFNIPFFEGNLMVDFGPPKQSNIIKRCPNCEALVPLKRLGAKEEIWKE